jgi:hypothetical protein
LKHIYRIIILLAVFIGALYYFSGDITEVVFETIHTTEMASFLSCHNQEDGMKSIFCMATVRILLPISSENRYSPKCEKAFEVIIDQKDYDTQEAEL